MTAAVDRHNFRAYSVYLPDVFLATGRFIQQQDLQLLRQRSCNKYALPLSAPHCIPDEKLHTPRNAEGKKLPFL